MPLKLENAAKRVGNRWIYRDVTLEVADGEVFGIFGSSASDGQSELIRSFGHPVANDANTSIFKRIFGSHSPATERHQRLMAAIADLNAPLIVEDPFSGLDRVGREGIAADIRRVAREKNIPVLFSTLDFSDILPTADRAAALIAGYIRQAGTPQELYDEPVNSAVAVLTGRHNLIEARRLTSSKADMPEFQTIEGSHRLFTQRAEIKDLGPINKNAWLAIRPEQISLSFGASFPEDNLLKAIITDVQFRGAVTYVGLDCGGLRVEAMVTRLIGLKPGDECMAALPPDRIRILTD